MKLQQLYSYTRKAVDDYHMIEDGDKIAIGISGGKDSLTLLYALAGLRRFYPKKFELCAISVNLGFDIDYQPIRKLCEELNVPFTVVETEIAKIIFEERKEGSPCSLCAKMRKGALNEKAKELGAFCETDENDYLTDIVERTSVMHTKDGIAYTEDGANFIPISGDSTVSMNLWGFGSSFLKRGRPKRMTKTR